MIGPYTLLRVYDKIAASYRSRESAQTAAVLADLTTVIVGNDGVAGTVYGSGDAKFIRKVSASSDAVALAAAPDAQNVALYRQLLTDLNGYLNDRTVSLGLWADLATYATYQNAQARLSWLLAPQAAYLQWLVNNTQPGLLLPAGCVFAPQTALGAVQAGPAAGAVTLAAGTAVATANDTVNGVQGYVPPPGVAALITVPINGTLAVTLTGDGWDAAGVPFVGRHWSAALDHLPAGATVTFAGPDGVTPATGPALSPGGGQADPLDLPDSPDSPESTGLDQQPGDPGVLVPSPVATRIVRVTGAAAAGSATAGAFSLVSLLERIVA